MTGCEHRDSRPSTVLATLPVHVLCHRFWQASHRARPQIEEPLRDPRTLLPPANQYRKQKLEHCRRLLGMPDRADPTDTAEKDYRDRYEELTGISLHQCPQCKQGRMVMVEI